MVFLVIYAETNASVCQNKASIYLLMCLYTTKRNIMLIDFGYLAYNNFCKNKNTKQYILSKELREPKSLKLSKKHNNLSEGISIKIGQFLLLKSHCNRHKYALQETFVRDMYLSIGLSVDLLCSQYIVYLLIY